MEMIEWKDSEYALGIAKIDEQHKQLVGLINALIKHRNKPDSEMFANILATVFVYTQTHLKDEEKILLKMNYPQFEAHHRRHEEFINAVRNIKAEFDASGASQKICDKMISFLQTWLIAHIQGEDRHYAKYLTE